MPGLRVRASTGSEPGQTVGYYGNKRRREGEEFELADPKHYSFRWMEPLDFDPEKDYALVPPSQAYQPFQPLEVVEAPGAVVQPESEAKKASRAARAARAKARREKAAAEVPKE